MATATANFTIKSSDGWTAVTSAASTFLTIQANSSGIFYLGAGASAPTGDGLQFRVEDDRDLDDVLLFPSGIGDKVWIKVADSNQGFPHQQMSFGVIST